MYFKRRCIEMRMRFPTVWEACCALGDLSDGLVRSHRFLTGFGYVISEFGTGFAKVKTYKLASLGKDYR